MAAGPVGARREPPNQPILFDVIGRYTDGTEETVEDRLVGLIRAGVTFGVAAAAVGTTAATVRRYLTDGGRVLRLIHEDGIDPLDFTDAEIEYAHFAKLVACAQAEADAELIITATGAARGGFRKTTVTQRRDPKTQKVLEETVREEILPPDVNMLKFLLQKLQPDTFGDAPIEIGGIDGAPIQIASVDMHAQIMAGLADFAAKLQADDDDVEDAVVVDDEPAELEPGDPDA